MADSKYVLDASALLALIQNEPGTDKVKKCLAESCMSAVNFSEALGKLILAGGEPASVQNLLSEIIPSIVPFDEIQASLAGGFILKTKALGLSLGDRACLALAKHQKTIAITADKAWAKLKIGVKVQVIR